MTGVKALFESVECLGASVLPEIVLVVVVVVVVGCVHYLIPPTLISTIFL